MDFNDVLDEEVGVYLLLIASAVPSANTDDQGPKSEEYSGQPCTAPDCMGNDRCGASRF